MGPRTSANGVAALVRLGGLLSLAIGVVAPLQVVVMASRGLSPAVIGLVFGSFALVGSLAEVPAGVVADRFGYRFVLVGGAALMAGGVLPMAVATSAPAFGAAAVLFAAGKALDSGALEALLVETVHRDPSTADVPEVLTAALARVSSARGVGVGVGAVASGLAVTALAAGGVPQSGDAVLIAPSVPLVVSGALLAGYAVVLRVVLVEEGWRRGQPPTTTSDVLAGLRSVTASPVLRLVAVRWLLLPVALTALHLVTPLRLTGAVGAGPAATLMGWLVAATYLSQGVSSRVAPVLRAWSGPWAPSVVLTLASGLVLALAGASASPVWLVVALTLLYLLAGPVGPLLGPTMHAAVPSRSRATVLSAASVVGNAGGFAGALLLGWVLGAAGAAWAYAIAGATMAAVALPLLALSRLDLSGTRAGVRPAGPR